MQFAEEFLKRLESLHLAARRLFAGTSRAERRSRRVGSGVEFADRRDYSAGDDLRYLDWAAYARFDRPMLRLFAEEEDLHIYLLIDASASMRGVKLDYAARLTAALGYVGLSELDRVGVQSFAGGLGARLPASRGRAHIFAIFRFLEALVPDGRTDLLASLRAFVRQTKRRGLVLLLSDFYDESYAEGIDLLRHHRFEPTVLQLYDPEEAHPAARARLGDLELVDAESGDTRQVTISHASLATYERAHAAWCERLAHYCRSHAVGYFRADVSVPYDEMVLRVLRHGGLVA